jgi:methylated-DNA-[protein]-cysteine S-methyltransferase
MGPHDDLWRFGEELGAGPEAARDVGQAMARNPVALIIPCHRVLATQFLSSIHNAKRSLGSQREQVFAAGLNQARR